MHPAALFCSATMFILMFSHNNLLQADGVRAKRIASLVTIDVGKDGALMQCKSATAIGLLELKHSTDEARAVASQALIASFDRSGRYSGSN
jgi:hypothetical protein